MEKDDKNISAYLSLLIKTIMVLTGAYLFLCGLSFIVYYFILLFGKSGIERGYAPILLVMGIKILFSSLIPILSFFKLKKYHSKYWHIGMAILSLLCTYYAFRLHL